MKLTQRAIAQLLQSLAALCRADYVQISKDMQLGFERQHHGTLDKELQKIKLTESEDFVSEVQHIHEEFAVSISLLSSKHITLKVLISQLQPTSTEQRQQSYTTIADIRYLDIEVLSKKTFPDWLLKLAQEVDGPTSHEQTSLLDLCTALFSSISVFSQFNALTVDSLTKLKTRSALQREIDESFNAIKLGKVNGLLNNNDATHSRHVETLGISICLIHCRDFQLVNRKFGQAKGDQVLNEIAAIINQQTRSQDIACRFGGALFGVAIHAQGIAESEQLAQKLQTALHNRPYLQNALRLSFNVGLAFIETKDLINEDSTPSSLLISRAEQALKAAQSSDRPSIVQWEADTFKHDEHDLNYIGSIFTPDTVTNYRNMLLLWDISSIFADEYEFSRLVTNVVERLACTFEFSAAGIVSSSTELIVEYAISVSKMADVAPVELNQLLHQHKIRALATEALAQNQHVEHNNEKERFLLLPLGSDFEACFFLEGKHDSLDLSRDAIMLFAGFARQIGKALKRSQLEDELNKRLEQQNAELEEELNALKSGLQSSALVYRSAPMQKIMSQTQRAAQTDTTVLITGESGTGKERLIHAIHNLSPRHKKALVIVDCGSIPETLIESELFGYAKGAFTGAQQHSLGKIQAADGGILVLDEIGELPLSMQPKLLRFVQEKQYTPVGATRSVSVDVKIVAVTNRDLPAEVELGNFRQDLFFRLNVVSLHNPPLRERLDDLPLLCRHFLTKFANQFASSKKIVSPLTLQSMQQYEWPGNIRELENKLMQATLMCQGDEIALSDLNIAPINQAQHKTLLDSQPQENQTYSASESTAPSNAKQISSTPTSSIHTSLTNHKEQEEKKAANAQLPHWQSAWENALDDLLDEVLNTPALYEFEVGKHLERQIFEATRQCCKTNKDIASRLHIPVSTARRKVMKVQSASSCDMPMTWPQIAHQLEYIAQGSTVLEAPLEFIQLSLLSKLLSKNTRNMGQTAQLLGVSEPTLYKLKRQL